MTETKCAHVLISGIVQGVGYRFSTVHQAQKLGVSGWVRNLTDGRVEAIFEGNPEILDRMIAWCHQGPSSAQVTDVTVTYQQPQGLTGFTTRYK
ncbi:acylphosphatase [Phormidium pseudopriestleyi FRX01]|uniref:acylphosphatase n=1 Tax=Phormidium pseudopriestleyi FRX01 TaxID=1759528 RepID=A0ABS3FPQ2_9CYAN|nr:acylphosphatase [Phormidium pseudopriestleyi]MBO0349096.1 acylphosphatase [Phormidium pseudopriestleyi FRX01]